ncbi:MAG: sugar transferase [Acidobacteriota bacterium]
MRQHGWRLVLKSAIDKIVAATVLTLFSPLLVIVALAVRIRMGGPIFFRQLRPGLYGQPFQLMKFRTMTDEKDKNGSLLSDEDRLTSLGRFLRATSLDELPQLCNVLRGDMSLVGPRPLLIQYLSRYTQEQARRHNVLPGITGWAQIKGRNSLNWKEKFALDVWYVDNWSLWLDAYILVLTVWKVWRREGISRQGHATMPEFMGERGTK